MLRDAKVVTMLPVVDMDRARRFYEETLGLKLVATGLSGPLNPGLFMRLVAKAKYIFFKELLRGRTIQ